MMKPTKISLVMFIYVSSVLCVQIEWGGSNQDLVNEYNPIQGRENYKLMVALVGDRTKLVCDVAFATKPVKTIVWEIDGKPQNNKSIQKKEEDKTSGKVFINDTFEIAITEKMDDKRVSCVYDEVSVEIILHVFKLEIKKVCENCVGTVKLLFRECLRSKTGENNVDERIKSKIQNITKVTPNDKNLNSTYSVTLPIATAMDIPEVMTVNQDLHICCPSEMKPQEIRNKVDEKTDESAEIPWWVYIIGIVGGVVALVGLVGGVVMLLVKHKVIPPMEDWITQH